MRYLVVREITTSSSTGEPFVPPALIVRRASHGEPFETFEQAHAVAAEQANRSGNRHFVVKVVGVQAPVYDPNVGWSPCDD